MIILCPSDILSPLGFVNFAYLPVQDCFIVQIFQSNPANQVVLHPACYNFEIRGHMASDIPIITLHHAGFRAKFQNFVWV